MGIRQRIRIADPPPYESIGMRHLCLLENESEKIWKWRDANFRQWNLKLLLLVHVRLEYSYARPQPLRQSLLQYQTPQEQCLVASAQALPLLQPKIFPLPSPYLRHYLHVLHQTWE